MTTVFITVLLICFFICVILFCVVNSLERRVSEIIKEHEASALEQHKVARHKRKGAPKNDQQN